jgi:endonuclease III
MTTKAQSQPPELTSELTSGIEIPEAIRLLTERYGPFPQEPRLDPAHELVFTILSQHTSDINSERAFRRLMERFGSLDAVAAAGVAQIEEAISVGGLARVKAPRIKEILNRVLELNGGSLDLSFLAEMPLDEAKAWLRQLPGIGPKSAGIILSFALGMPAMAVDVHIYRVSQRLGLIGPKVNTDKAHDLLEEAIEPEQRFPFHVAFITHGRQTCKAQRPLCHECVVGFGCPSRDRFIQMAEASRNNYDKKPASTNGKRQQEPAPLPHTYPAEDGKK